MAKAHKMAALVAVGLVIGSLTVPAWGAPPTAVQMLGYHPRQEGVAFTTPTGDAVTACKVELVKGTKRGSGWLLRDSAGQPLRWFFDTNDDNKIDIWAYYKDGVEVYREIDTTYTGKPDQYRWLNTGGMKWGIDENKDGKIDMWKAISPEEVSQELLQALVKKDLGRLQALLLTEADIKELGLPADMAGKYRDQIKGVPAKFQDAVAKLTSLSEKATWQYLETKAPPRCLPADQIGTRYDVVKHVHCALVYDVAGKSDWIQTGEMVQVGLAWRLVDGPVPGMTSDEDSGSRPGGGRGDVPLPSTPMAQKSVQELTDLDKIQPTTDGSRNLLLAQHHLKRADILERIVAEVKPEERDPWIRQVADSLSTAAGSTASKDNPALTRLLSLEAQLASKMPGSNLAAYVTFREMQTDYSMKIADGTEFAKVQQQWMERLTKFVTAYPRAEDAPDATLQLGMVSEFLDKEVEAKNWYAQLVKNFPDKPQSIKAAGAIKRLLSDGTLYKLSGPTLQDPNVAFDVDQLRGKFVIVYYWAAWNTQCVGDFAKLKLLVDTYGKKGVELVCVNLDNKSNEGKEFLAKSPAPGTHLHQPGGLEGKLATDYGIMVLPNLFLIDRDGKVASRKQQITTLEDEVRKQLLK